MHHLLFLQEFFSHVLNLAFHDFFDRRFDELHFFKVGFISAWQGDFDGDVEETIVIDFFFSQIYQFDLFLNGLADFGRNRLLEPR